MNTELHFARDAHNAADWHSALYEIFELFDSFCTENDITYYLSYGGLIGALRHREIVPWDNDVDVLMDEENYLKFRQLYFDGKFPDNYSFVDRSTQDKYPLLFGRFVNTLTSCPLGSSSYCGGTHGLFIDVFLLLPVPSEKNAQKKAINDFLVWEELLHYPGRRCSYRPPVFIDRWKEVKALEAKYGTQYALDYIEKSFRSYIPQDPTAYICSSGGAYFGWPVMKKEWFDSVIRVPFGPITLSAPVGAWELLQSAYGSNWRMMPPNEKFTAYAAADLNIPGNVITDDYMYAISSEEAFQTFTDVKKVRMDELVIGGKQRRAFACLNAELIATKLNKDLSVYKEQMHFMNKLENLKAQSFDLNYVAKICDEFMSVFTFSNAKEFKNDHVAIPLRDDILLTALWSYFISRDDFWTVEKLITRHKEDEKLGKFPTNNVAQALEHIIDAVNKLYIAIDKNSTELATKHLSVIDSLCPQCVHHYVGNLFLLQEDPQKTIEYIQTLPNAYKDNDYVRFYHFAALLKTSVQTVSQNDLQAFVDECNNGMILLWMKDLCCELNYELSIVARSKKASKSPDIKFPRIASFGIKGALVSLKYNLPALRKSTEKVAALKPLVKEPLARYTHYKKLKRLTSSRFMAWERTYPKKNLILQAAEHGNLEELRTLADSYLKVAYRIYDNDGLGLNIDNEILEATKPVIIQERGEEFYSHFVSLIPEEHKESIVDLLKRKNVEHPYL